MIIHSVDVDNCDNFAIAFFTHLPGDVQILDVCVPVGCHA